MIWRSLSYSDFHRLYKATDSWVDLLHWPVQPVTAAGGSEGWNAGATPPPRCWGRGDAGTRSASIMEWRAGLGPQLSPALHQRTLISVDTGFTWAEGFYSRQVVKHWAKTRQLSGCLFCQNVAKLYLFFLNFTLFLYFYLVVKQKILALMLKCHLTYPHRRQRTLFCVLEH